MAKKTVTDDIVNAVISGKYGAGSARKEALTKEGYDYDEVQREVTNRISNYGKTTNTVSSGTSSATSGTSTPTSASTSGTNYITYSSDGKPSYTSRYQSQIDDVNNQLLNRQPFSYDYTTDDTYKQYEKEYTRQGDIAMRDTLGQVAARTGGLASSYAGTAAQQQYNSYMKELSAKIPELEQLAYNMYLNEENSLRNDLSALLALEQNDYSHYTNELNDYYNQQQLQLQKQQLAAQQLAAQQKAAQEQNETQAATENVGAMVSLATAAANATKGKYTTQNTSSSNTANSDKNSNNSLNNSDYISNSHASKISKMNGVSAKKYLENQVDNGSLSDEEAYKLWVAYSIAPTTYEELKLKTGNNSLWGPGTFNQYKTQGIVTGSYENYLKQQWNAYLLRISGDSFNDQYLLGGL